MSFSMICKTVLAAAVALLFAACSGSVVSKSAASKSATSTGSRAAAVATVPPTQAASPSTTAALEAVVKQADQEQQRAFTQKNPRLMQDTATQSYYQQLQQTNSDLASGGVTAFQLVKLDWGPVSVSGSQAQLTSFETWSTTYADGTTSQSTDRNVYTLVKQAGAWKIQADDHPDATGSQSGSGSPGVVSVPGAPTTPGLPAPSTSSDPNGQGLSQNWAGYEADGGVYTAVSGTWTVPQVDASGAAGADATWVGIGGVNSHDLIQAGTEATVTGNGTVQDRAWVEMLPQASQPVPLTVHMGDSVSVSIAEQSAGQWLITMKDNTTGQSYHVTEQYDSSRSSAEWVEEAPSGGRRVAPLDSFGAVKFSSAAAVRDGKSVDLSQAGAQPITMANAGGAPLAVPSALGSDGKSFSVSRTSNSSQSLGGGFGPSGIGRRPSFAP
jgi:ketosteroid isomerase-like protein